MPTAFQILPDANLLITRFSGYVGCDDYRSCYSETLNDADHSIGLDELGLVEPGTVFDVSFDSIKAVAADVAEANKGVGETFTTAVVMPESVPTWNMKLYDEAARLTGSPERVMIFETIAEALASLNRSERRDEVDQVLEELEARMAA